MASFTCNLCGAECQANPSTMGRELASCHNCGSSILLRAMAALLLPDLLGVPLGLFELPQLKSIRGIGMSAPAALADPLAKKLNYTNTFYDRTPRLDVTAPSPDLGRFDFIVSSEVMEH